MKLQITERIYAQLVAELDAYTDADAYVSDMALPSIWGDEEGNPDIPAERIAALQRYWEIANMPVREIAKAEGLSFRRLAMRFGIPQRTITNWTLPETSSTYHLCPLYTKLMMAECLGLLPFEIV